MKKIQRINDENLRTKSKKDFVLDEQQNIEKRNKIKLNSHFWAEIEGRIEEKTQIILDEYQMKRHKISSFLSQRGKENVKKKENARKKGMCKILSLSNIKRLLLTRSLLQYLRFA